MRYSLRHATGGMGPGVEARLGGRGAGLDREDLLLDGVVEIARETVPLLLRGRVPYLLFVEGAGGLGGAGLRRRLDDRERRRHQRLRGDSQVEEPEDDGEQGPRDLGAGGSSPGQGIGAELK
jgi:hypothetical protein